jgi:hypothetical protein
MQIWMLTNKLDELKNHYEEKFEKLMREHEVCLRELETKVQDEKKMKQKLGDLIFKEKRANKLTKKAEDRIKELEERIAKLEDNKGNGCKREYDEIQQKIEKEPEEVHNKIVRGYHKTMDEIQENDIEHFNKIEDTKQKHHRISEKDTKIHSNQFQEHSEKAKFITKPHTSTLHPTKPHKSARRTVVPTAPPTNLPHAVGSK